MSRAAVDSEPAAPAVAASPSRARVAACCAALALLTLVLYAPATRYGFIGYDDPLYVDNARARQGLTWANVGWAFELGPDHAGNYHPLTWLSHMLDFTLAGPRAGFHHAHNAVLHAAAAVALLLALYRATRALGPAAFVAAAFAWHPLHVQSVAWVAERKDVLSGLFFSLTIVAYVPYARRPSAGRYVTVILLGAAAMLAKPMLVTLPFVLLLLDHWPLRRAERSGRAWGRLAAEKLPLLAASVAVSALTVLAQQASGAIRSAENVPIAARVANAVVSYLRYLYLTVWPRDLAIFYPYRIWPAAVVAGCAGLLLAITAVALWQRRRRPYLIVGWLIYLGMLVPAIGLVQVGEQSIADRYTYLPLIGVFVMLAFLGGESRPRAFVVAAGAALLAAMFATSAWQLRFWRDDLALFGRALEVTRDNYIAHAYVGKSLAARGDDAAALSHYDRAIAIKPVYWEAHYNRGNLLLRAGRTAEAIAAYRRAVEINPRHTDAWNNLGIALAMQGEFVEAERSLLRAAELAPGRSDVQANLARVRARLTGSK